MAPVIDFTTLDNKTWRKADETLARGIRIDWGSSFQQLPCIMSGPEIGQPENENSPE